MSKLRNILMQVRLCRVSHYERVTCSKSKPQVLLKFGTVFMKPQWENVFSSHF